MGKRIFSLLLALAMVVSMIPASAIPTFAAETETGVTLPNIYAAYASNVSVEGTLDESAWLTYGKMVSEDQSTTKSFGVLWNTENLYFAGNGTDDVTVVVNGVTATATAVKGTDAWELCVPMTSVNVTDLDFGKSVEVSLTSGSCSWNGTVTLDAIRREYTPSTYNYAGAAKTAGGTASWDKETPGVITMKNTHAEGSTATNTDFCIRVSDITATPMWAVNRVSVLEFDFAATDMPGYSDTPAKADNYNLCEGFVLAAFQGANGFGYTIGIANTLTDGLHFCAIAGGKYQSVRMNKNEGDTFHVRVEFDRFSNLVVYVDDVLLHTFTGAAVTTGWNTGTLKMLNFNLWDKSGSSESMEFTLSGIRVSSKAYNASVHEVVKAVVDVPEVDGTITEDAWGMPSELAAVTGTGVRGNVVATWKNGYLYLGVSHVNAEELTVALADKTWTLPLAAGNVASEDGLVTGVATASAVELKVDMLASGAEIWNYFNAKPLQLILKNGENTAALTAGAHAWVEFSSDENARFGQTKVQKVASGSVVTAYESTDGTLKFTPTGDRWFSGLASSMINHAYDTYVERELTINTLEGSTGVLNSWHDGAGISMWIVDQAFPAPTSGTAGTGTGACMFLDGDVLKLNVYSNDGVQTVDLGKGLGETFTLGYLWTSDNRVVVFVDGYVKGTVSNVSVYKTGIGHDTFTININKCTADFTVHYTEFTTARGSVAPTNSLDGLMTGVDTANLVEDLPATYTNGHFTYNVDWNSDNTDIISDSGKVTQAEETTVVTLKPMVAGATLGTVEVTVPGNEKLELATGTYDAYVAADITVDGALSEQEWIPGSQLGLGQDFDILWDGENLYFGVEAADGDTELTVLLGDETLTTVTLADGASAFEVKLPYTTDGVTELADLTLKVGKSGWKGDVTLVSMVRDRLLGSELTIHPNTTDLVKYVGNGFNINIPGASTPDNMPAGYIYQLSPTFFENPEQLGLAFDFDPSGLPAVGPNSVGKVWPAYSGFRIVVAKLNGTAVQLNLFNNSETGNITLVVQRGANTTRTLVDLGRKTTDGEFNIELLWTSAGALDVSVNGVYLDTVENAEATDANMEGTNTATNHMVYFTGHRYGYVTTDHRKDYYTQSLDFTVTNIVLSKDTEVLYPSDIQTATGTYDAFVASGVNADGFMSETAWRTGAELGGGQPFDILFDGNNLYFGVVAATGDESMTVKIGDEVVAETSLVSGTTAMEAVVPYLTKDVTKIENVTITVGNSVWTGDVNLNLYSRVYKPDFTDTSVFDTVGVQYYSGNAPDGNLSYSATSDSVTAANEYKEGKLNEINGRVYVLQAKTFTLADNRTDDMVVEFDFVAESLPAYTRGKSIGVTYATYGFNGVIGDSNQDGLHWGIMKASEDGKLDFVIVWQTVDGSTDDSSVKHIKTLQLGKTEGEKFSIRLVWTADNSVSVYCDGELVGTVEDCFTKHSLAANVFGFNLWGPGGDYALTADGANDNKWTVSNVRVGKTAQVDYSIPDDGKITAPFVDVAPAADSMTWDSLSWESFANGEGKAAVLICDQKVYLAVNATGAVSATLGSETKTADADGIVVLTFDDTLVTEYGQQLNIALTLDGTAAWDDGAVVTVVQKVLNPSGVMPTNDASSRVTFGDGTYTMSTTDSVDNSNGAYILLRKTFLNDLADHNSDLLFEQTMTITKMSHGDLTGTFPGGPVNNHGYTIMVEYGLARTYSTVIGPDASGNLSIYAYTADKSVQSLALGKKVGDTFKLGLLWAVDGSTTVYVDNVKIGTIENAAYADEVYNAAASDISMLIKYQDAVCNADNPAEITATIPVLTKFGTQVALPELETEVTKEAIFGDLDLTNVTEALPLTTTFQSAYLGQRTLSWTSSNPEAVENNGNIHPNATESKSATLSVYLDGGDTALWTVDVTVPASNEVMDALLSETAVEVDGDLSEVVWANWKKFTNPNGNLAAAWTRGYVFFAAHGGDADTLTLTVNGKVITVNLAEGTASGVNNIQIAKNASTGVVEIGIPLTELAVELTDYNQQTTFNAKLHEGTAYTELTAVALNFSGKIAESQSLSSYTKSSGPWTLLPTSINYNGYEPGIADYVYKTNCNLDHTGLIILSNDFQFDKLPITTGAMINASAQADGFYYYFSDEDPDTRKGTTICASIFTTDGTNLWLRIGQGQNKEGTVFELNKTLGQKFRITYYWYANNNLDIFVDGVLLGTVANAGYATSHLGVDVITYRYYSAEVTTEKVNFTVSDQTIIKQKYNSVIDELTQNAIFGRVDLEHVQKDLPMVTTFNSQNFDALNLEWTTSNAGAVAVDGTVTRHTTEYQSAVITVYLVEGEEKTELWSVTVTVDPLSVTKQPAPAVIHTAFTAPGTVTLDGALTDEGWLMNGWVVTEAGQPAGYFGAQWDQNYLYLALKTDAVTTVTLGLGEKTAVVNLSAKTITGVAGTVAVSGINAEVRIPVSEIFGVEKIESYNKTLPITVTMGDSSYEGTLKLTNVDWWATDNVDDGLPMLSGNYASQVQGSDPANGNHGAKQLENGWRVYDLYDPNGTNPASIRTYILFMKMPIYENFADRTEATHIEFDFDAKALPVREWDDMVKNNFSRAFANYGVTFSLSDKADSGKNSNVAVFGIANTTEGLQLVVNRGAEDYEAFKLNKQVGEEFRIGLTWLTNSNLVLSIDGEEFITIEGMSKWVNSVGDTSFVVNMFRDKTRPTSAEDNMDVYLTNIAFGKAHSTENIIRNLTFADICGTNETESEIIADLELPGYMTNGQLEKQYPITWTSSNTDVVDPETGAVTRPESGVKTVTLTATLDNNGTTESKEFTLIVLGETVDNGNALVAGSDTNPFGTAAYTYTGLLYNLDKTNNSVVYAFPEGETTKINLVTLTDLDEVARLNRESLRLFYSQDNVTYTEIDSYKLHHDGCNWYLYNFEAEARYIKVHYTHRDYEGSDFVNTPGDMINVSWEDSLVIPAEAAEIAVPATTLRDEAVAITLPDGISAENLRVALGNEILFHYVDKSGTVYVRIADPTNGTLKLWNADGIEIADKENVYEVTYGTRETLPTSGRWVLGMKAGQIFPNGETLAVDTLYRMGSSTVEQSTDGGYTWSRVGAVTHDTALSSGGWGIDSISGRLFHEFYGPTSFTGSDVTKSVSVTMVFYSDDGGKTWTKADGLGKIDGDKYSNYVLSYTDITELTYDPVLGKGNDGTGPNVDFVFPMGAQYNNNGAFCGRVAYTTDGGLSWKYSDSLITYGNETAFEGGVSEATILEREDGTLVYYARCQSSGVDNFTISYSLDHGVTWMTPGATSSIYTTNTQALMMTYDFDGFDGNRITGAPIFMWGGNNVLGGNSYMRMPLNFAVSTNGMDTFRNIQNIFSETFMDVYSTEADHYITNPSIQQINGDDMYVAFSRLYHKDSIYMVVNDFTDWFVRTKGAYDSFEHGNAQYEGWSVQRGAVTAVKDNPYEGKYSMLVADNTNVARSIPYLQKGTVSIAVYATANSKFVFELQPAFSTTKDKCAVLSANVVGTTMTMTDGTVFALDNGWNTLDIDLDLIAGEASISVNGRAAAAVDANLEVGNYISYVAILASNSMYVDEMLIVSGMDAVTEATEAEEAAADALVEDIKAIGDVTIDDEAAIKAARATYNAMNQVERDFVNRRVPTGTTTNVNAEGALINYYEVLLAAEEALKLLKPEDKIVSESISLKGKVDVNLYVSLTEETLEDENAYMLFTKDGDEDVKVYIADAEKKDVDGQILYVFSYSVPAKEMTDEITAQFFYGNGSSMDAETYSVKGYGDFILEDVNNTYGDKLKTLVKNMLHFGAAAQTHFDYNTENMANEGVESVDLDSVSVTTVSGHAHESTATGYELVSYYGNSLILKGETTVRFFFQVKEGGSLTVKNGEDTLEVKQRGDLYYVSVENIAAKDLSTDITLTVSDGTNEFTVTANALTYAYNVLKAAEGTYGEDLVDLVQALTLYSQAADSYYG